MNLSGLDIVFVVLIVFAALRAGIRGFVHEFLSMAAVILGIAAAVLFSGLAAQWIQPYIGAGPWAQVVAFLGLFLVVYVVVKLFENALNRLVEHINLESLDRALGFFLGIAEGLFLVFVLVLVLQLQPVFDADPILAESQFARFFLPLLPYAERVMSVGI
tara:strand:+ start:86 stop:565 length:480 start_codon:yes stop_codon:yes gene_type:complete